jgi:hypothetical protein
MLSLKNLTNKILMLVPFRGNQLFSFKGDDSMTKLERLQRDSDELMNFVEKLAEEGNQDLVKKLQVKKAFLDQRLVELSQEYAA